jgi:hypothetical protein
MGILATIAALYSLVVGGSEVYQGVGSGSSITLTLSGLPSAGNLVGSSQPVATQGYIDLAVALILFIIAGSVSK